MMSITIFYILLLLYAQGNMVKNCVVPKLSGNSATPFLLGLLFEFSHLLGPFFPSISASLSMPPYVIQSPIFLFDTVC
jgi:hypothetical protein